LKHQILALARQCRRDGEHKLAQQIEEFLPKNESNTLFYFRPSEDYRTDVPSSSEQAFRKLRQEQARFLMRQAHNAAQAGKVDQAFGFLYEALYYDGDLAEARNILGQKKASGRWVSSEAASRLERGEQWSDQFGWLPDDHLDRYLKGKRYFRGRWISATKDTRQHSDIRNGWEIETDHYQVTTNHSLEAGVALAQKLEAFYTVWSQLFASYYLTTAEAQKQFTNPTMPKQTSNKHKVLYFRSRGEYDRALSRTQPGIAGRTLGVYLEQPKTAYFFAPSTASAEEREHAEITIWHEAAHQLFAEKIPSRKVSSLKNNFWLVEGIACFMETLRQEKQGWRLGGLRAGRLPAARLRLAQDQFYVPFAELVTYTSEDLLRNPKYRTLYTQAAGQATFLMAGAEGKFRSAAIDYLRKIYRGRARLNTLATVTGQSFADLDRSYRDFLLYPSKQSAE